VIDFDLITIQAIITTLDFVTKIFIMSHISQLIYHANH